MLKLGPRQGDSTHMCRLELVGDELRSEFAARSSSRNEPASKHRFEVAEAGEEGPVTEAAPLGDEGAESGADAEGTAALEDSGGADSEKEGGS